MAGATPARRVADTSLVLDHAYAEYGDQDITRYLLRREDFTRRIGLRTNASSMTLAQFVKRFVTDALKRR